jgi:hypothetical protein
LNALKHVSLLYRTWRDQFLEQRLRTVARDDTAHSGQLPDCAPEAEPLLATRCEPDIMVLGEPLMLNPDSYDRITEVTMS